MSPDPLPSDEAGTIPGDLDNGKGRQLVAALTPLVRAADEQHGPEGGSTRHWVRDCFLPHLRAAGWTIGPERIDMPRREVEALREALRFYSDGFAYLTPEGWRRIWRDGGQVAREALAHFNQETE